MGACGCIEIRYTSKVIDADGYAILFGVYSSCDYCCSPAGMQFFRVAPEDFYLWDVEHVPDFEFYDNGMQFIPLVSPEVVRQKMQEAIVGFAPRWRGDR